MGGTAEARQLASLLLAAGFAPVTSLAGLTQTPGQIQGERLTGGFGGTEGLLHHLREERYAALVDAAHPFALTISHHAKEAAELSGLPLVRLERPAWEPEAGDRWTEVADNKQALAALPAEARVFLTIGRKEVLLYFGRADISGIARMIEPPQTAVPHNWRVILARPPFTVAEEARLLAEASISHLITKNSGGDETRAKLTAARLGGTTVIMIKRPQKPAVASFASARAALAYLAQVVGA